MIVDEIGRERGDESRADVVVVEREMRKRGKLHVLILIIGYLTKNF